MVRKRCYQKLDEPILVWPGVEFPELALSLAVGFGAGIVLAVLGTGFLGLLLGFPAGALVASFFKLLRKGGPGYAFSQVYKSGFLSLLPPGGGPTHLLPAPRPGHSRRFRLSAIEGNDDSSRRLRLRYFGR